jgi:DNA-directed RNA polymerase specialized sigma24 family protein
MKTETTAVQWKLVEWARWRHAGAGVNIGYPTQTPFRRLLGGSVATAMIADEEGEKIDRAVSRLLDRCRDQGEVLVLYYVEGMTVQTVARKQRLSYEHARRLLAQAETAIDYMITPVDNSGVRW